MAPEEESRLMLQEEDRGRMASSDIDILNPEGYVPESIRRNREAMNKQSIRRLSGNPDTWQAPIESLEKLFPKKFTNRYDHWNLIPGNPESYKAFALAKKKGYNKPYREFVYDVFSENIDPKNPGVRHHHRSKLADNPELAEILSKFVV